MNSQLARLEAKNFFEMCVPEDLRPYFAKVAKENFPEEWAEVETLKAALDATSSPTDHVWNCAEYVRKSKYLIRQVGLILHKQKSWKRL